MSPDIGKCTPGSKNVQSWEQQLDDAKIFTFMDFPGSPVVKNLPANAGGHGFDPWSGKTPPAVGQLSLCPTTTEPVPWSPCSATRETTAMRSLRTTAWEHPHLPQPEKPACSIKDPAHTPQKNRNNNKNLDIQYN